MEAVAPPPLTQASRYETEPPVKAARSATYASTAKRKKAVRQQRARLRMRAPALKSVAQRLDIQVSDSARSVGAVMPPILDFAAQSDANTNKVLDTMDSVANIKTPPEAKILSHRDVARDRLDQEAAAAERHSNHMMNMSYGHRVSAALFKAMHAVKLGVEVDEGPGAVALHSIALALTYLGGKSENTTLQDIARGARELIAKELRGEARIDAWNNLVQAIFNVGADQLPLLESNIAKAIDDLGIRNDEQMIQKGFDILGKSVEGKMPAAAKSSFSWLMRQSPDFDMAFLIGATYGGLKGAVAGATMAAPGGPLAAAGGALIGGAKGAAAGGLAAGVGSKAVQALGGMLQDSDSDQVPLKVTLDPSKMSHPEFHLISENIFNKIVLEAAHYQRTGDEERLKHVIDQMDGVVAATGIGAELMTIAPHVPVKLPFDIGKPSGTKGMMWGIVSAAIAMAAGIATGAVLPAAAIGAFAIMKGQEYDFANQNPTAPGAVPLLPQTGPELAREQAFGRLVNERSKLIAKPQRTSDEDARMQALNDEIRVLTTEDPRLGLRVTGVTFPKNDGVVHAIGHAAPTPAAGGIPGAGGDSTDDASGGHGAGGGTAGGTRPPGAGEDPAGGQGTGTGGGSGVPGPPTDGSGGKPPPEPPAPTGGGGGAVKGDGDKCAADVDPFGNTSTNPATMLFAMPHSGASGPEPAAAHRRVLLEDNTAGGSNPPDPNTSDTAAPTGGNTAAAAGAGAGGNPKPIPGPTPRLFGGASIQTIYYARALGLSVDQIAKMFSVSTEQLANMFGLSEAQDLESLLGKRPSPLTPEVEGEPAAKKFKVAEAFTFDPPMSTGQATIINPFQQMVPVKGAGFYGENTW